ncbi:CaiB/BaiF CoA transferase family protein [Piscinibacter sakaiensis]|uniref:L-carnitine dehydratase/bile acid-inducible protein F n=1 Tax=Piscinibacter sakaiensis TaxID=1547922 RepID=A0A0K8NZ81_PISS1|nr:CoA transferase [Piscinibacter sakaiensis]GAP35678.1 L-carnitine dehydratase/bile acid-inducible protein F [Piscinibacter sakaiensis]
MAALPHRDEAAAGPLAGCRVLELGSTASGPFCARLLADFGAEVVKVEDPEGDTIRGLGQTVDGKSLYAASICRNKRIVSIDLRQPAGRDLLLATLPRFDIVVENFRPGTLERWGLGYDVLTQSRPDLILTRVSGFGQTGPYSARPGYGVIGEAMSGLRQLIGDPDRPPSRVAMPLTDYITGLYAALGTVMAALHRERTGQGQVVDVSLIESAFSFMESHVPAFDKTGAIGMRCGPRLPQSAPNTLFPTADGSHVHIAALADAVFRRLTCAMGDPALGTDPRFATQAGRNAHEEELEALIGAWTRRLPTAALTAALDAQDVPATPIYSMADIFADPHYRARDMLVRTPDEDLGEVTLAGVVPKLSATPGRIRWSGHRIGQDTREVLQALAGLDDARIDALEAAGVVACDPQRMKARRTRPATAPDAAPSGPGNDATRLP